MSITLAVISTVVAVGSLGFSLFALWRQHAAAGRAHFTADWEDSRTLVFVNHGPGPAREITATLRSNQGEGETLTVPYTGPFQPTRLVAERRLYEVFGPLVLSWRDDRRVEQRIEVQLSTQPNPRRSTATNAPDLEKAIRAIAQQEAGNALEDAARQARRRRL